MMMTKMTMSRGNRRKKIRNSDYKSQNLNVWNQQNLRKRKNPKKKIKKQTTNSNWEHTHLLLWKAIKVENSLENQRYSCVVSTHVIFHLTCLDTQ